MTTEWFSVSATCKFDLSVKILLSAVFIFSSLLVSAVMFHATVSEQTPDTPVSQQSLCYRNSAIQTG